MKQPVRVAITGAAGQIGYGLLFRIANGDLLGKDQPVILQLLEITPALPALGGVVMELTDCAFPLVTDIVTSDDANAAFNGVNYALLVGSRPRTKGMERKELLEVNGAIFTTQGKALAAGAADDTLFLVLDDEGVFAFTILAGHRLDAGILQRLAHGNHVLGIDVDRPVFTAQLHETH